VVSGANLRREIFLVRRRDRGLSSAGQALLEVVMKRRPKVAA
jgi:hypothetical protein